MNPSLSTSRDIPTTIFTTPFTSELPIYSKSGPILEYSRSNNQLCDFRATDAVIASPFWNRTADVRTDAINAGLRQNSHGNSRLSEDSIYPRLSPSEAAPAFAHRLLIREEPDHLSGARQGSGPGPREASACMTSANNPYKRTGLT